MNKTLLRILAKFNKSPLISDILDPAIFSLVFLGGYIMGKY